ncbi:MAG: hypothetical protein ACTHKB_12640, partial [Burkholderiaceae bacterium]
MTRFWSKLARVRSLRVEAAGRTLETARQAAAQAARETDAAWEGLLHVERHVDDLLCRMERAAVSGATGDALQAWRAALAEGRERIGAARRALEAARQEAAAAEESVRAARRELQKRRNEQERAEDMSAKVDKAWRMARAQHDEEESSEAASMKPRGS